MGGMPAVKTYHHGNLRAALLDASFTLIQEKGLEKFSLRELAGKTGVSHTAAYRHFRDKDHLVSSLSAGIYKRIGDRITFHSLKGLTPVESLEWGAMALLKYWLNKPGELRLLVAINGETSRTTNAAMEALEKLVGACRWKTLSVEQATLLVWAQMHGLADLANREQTGFQSKKKVLETAQAGLRAWLGCAAK